jgi:thymidylate synthase
MTKSELLRAGVTMINLFEGDSADQVWQMAESRLSSANAIQAQPSRIGETKELLHVCFAIEDPRQRWVISREPAMNPAFAIAEVIWILSGRNDSAFLNFWNTKLPEFAGHSLTYHGAYGFRLLHHFKLDQLDRAYHALKNNPDSRQIVLQIWDPSSDLPDERGHPVAEDIPCNVCALLKVRSGKLEWLQIMRSNDLYRGLPYNFVQFTYLQEVVAGWLGIELGTYNQISDSLHVYQKDIPRFHASKPITAEKNADILQLPKNESDIVFADMSHRIEALTDINMMRDDLLTVASLANTPSAYKNLLLVVAAESARRRGWIEDAQELIKSCTNLLLVQAWQRWFSRCQVTQQLDTVVCLQ